MWYSTVGIFGRCAHDVFVYFGVPNIDWKWAGRKKMGLSAHLFGVGMMMKCCYL